MRILAVHPGPNFSVADVHSGWVDALRGLGVEVADCNLGDRLSFYCAAIEDTGEAIRLTNNSLHAVCYQYRPDVLLITSCMYLTAAHIDVIRAQGTRIVILHTESPYEDDVQVLRAAHADLNLVNDPTNLDRFRQAAPTWYVPHAYRPDRHFPRTAADPDHASDFCFVGTAFPSRIGFFEAVDWTGIDVALAGHWMALGEESPLRKYVAHDIEECLPNERAADLYAGTKVSANLYRREANRPDLSDGWAMGPREVELAAMGVFFLRDPRGESDEVLPMLPTFADPGDFAEQLRWWLAHPAERAERASRARAAVAGRTFAAHAQMLLRLLGA
jgi:spore maturation protein CgeB